MLYKIYENLKTIDDPQMWNFFGIFEAMSMSSEAVFEGFQEAHMSPQSSIRLGPYYGKHAWLMTLRTNS